MTNSPCDDAALLDNALVAIEEVLARTDPRCAARSSIEKCLASAAVLVDVSRALMRDSAARTAEELEREWKTLIGHTKAASRSIYSAALIMAAQRNLPEAQIDGTAEGRSIEPQGAARWL